MTAAGAAARMAQVTARTGPVLLVGSSGGHLAQLLALRPWWADEDRA